MAITDHDRLARIYLDFNFWIWPKDLPEHFKPSFWDQRGIESFRLTSERKHGFALPFIEYIKSVVLPDKIKHWQDLRNRIRKNSPYQFVLTWPRGHSKDFLLEEWKKALKACLMTDDDEVTVMESPRPLDEMMQRHPTPIKNTDIIQLSKIEPMPSAKILKEERKKEIRKGWKRY